MQWQSNVGGNLGENAKVLTKASLTDLLNHFVGDLPSLTIYIAMGPID